MNQTLLFPGSTLSKDFPSCLEQNSYSLPRPLKSCLTGFLPAVLIHPSLPATHVGHTDFLAVPEQATAGPSLRQLPLLPCSVVGWFCFVILVSA